MDGWNMKGTDKICSKTIDRE